MKRTMQIGLLATLAAVLLVGLIIPASAQRSRAPQPAYAPPGHQGGSQQWQAPGQQGGSQQWQAPGRDCPYARWAPPGRRMHRRQWIPPRHRRQFDRPWHHRYGPRLSRPYDYRDPRGGDWRHRGGGHDYGRTMRRGPGGATSGGYYHGRGW